MRVVVIAALVWLACACTPAERAEPLRRSPLEDPGPFGLRGDPAPQQDPRPSDPAAPPAPPDDAPPDSPPPDDGPPDSPPPDDGPPDEPPPDDPPPDEPPAQCASGPLELPLEGCAPAMLPSTGDPQQDCVDRINQLRAECQCLPPLQRWSSGEQCADRMAHADHDSGQAHGAAAEGMCEWGSGQNECPGWGSVDDVIGGCLQMMWDEGPGEDFWSHGHYLNMSGLEKTHVACGFFEGTNGMWAVQNYY